MNQKQIARYLSKKDRKARLLFKAIFAAAKKPKDKYKDAEIPKEWK